MEKNAQIIVRVSEAMKKELLNQAREDHRTMTGQIEWLIMKERMRRDEAEK